MFSTVALSCPTGVTMRLKPVSNPPNPYLTEHAEWLEPPPLAKVEVYEETAQSILTRNDSPDIPFRWSVNPYRGCQHACAYCYARPYHEYLGYGAGTDFDTRLVVKMNAPQLLRREFGRSGWTFEPITFSGITDCYQPIEACYRVTRKCLEVCAAYRNPASIVTKSCLVARDVDVLAELHRRAAVRVYVSIPFIDAELCGKIEPQAPPPQRRLDVVQRLRAAGLTVGVMVAPIIPGLNDDQIAEILRQAADAGATCASYTALRLPGSVEAVFLERLAAAVPLRAQRVINRIKDMRGGKLSESQFGKRMRGEGVYWDSIRDLFEMARDRFGLTARPLDKLDEDELSATSPAPPQLTFNFST